MTVSHLRTLLEDDVEDLAKRALCPGVSRESQARARMSQSPSKRAPLLCTLGLLYLIVHKICDRTLTHTGTHADTYGFVLE